MSNFKRESGGDGSDEASASRSAKRSLGYKFSTSNEKIKDHYDAVVVGSGYGASVIAHRLSSKFKNMCILERGKEWHPGDFPEDAFQLHASIKNPVNPLGLIDISPGRDIDIICGNGLGGTSLLNAAIAIRPERNVFQEKEWPDAIRKASASGELEKYYQKAEAMLQPQKQNQLRFLKTQEHKATSEAQGRQWDELNLNIRPDSYEPYSENSFGYPQNPCVNCGNCCTGCNYGAKNTLLTNYLYAAARSGVKIFTQVEVESVEKNPSGGYYLNLKIIPWLGLGFVTRKQITANYVFLGAGSKGSTEILLRSQAKGMGFSKHLGSRLSANGDVMGMSYNGRKQTNVLQNRHTADPGVIISSYANYRNPSPDGDVQSQFLVLDGVVPSSLSAIVSQALARYGTYNFEELYTKFHDKDYSNTAYHRMAIDQNSIDATAEGALNHSMLYFACGHDSSGGKYVYDKETDSTEYVWPDVLKEPTFVRINKTLEKFTEANGGIYIPNPRSTIFGQKIQATHPLGGCPMGETVAKGVVNHKGQVFQANGAVHENLYVVDAAIIPRSLAATPLLTITALAERIADKLLA